MRDIRSTYCVVDMNKVLHTTVSAAGGTGAQVFELVDQGTRLYVVPVSLDA